MTHLPQELVQRLLDFRAERDWAQFHNARSLAAALSVEASELLEHFIWTKDHEVAGSEDRDWGSIVCRMAALAAATLERADVVV